MPAYSLRRTRADIPGLRQIVTLSADRQPFATLLHTTSDDWLLHLSHTTPDGPAYDYSTPDGRYPDESTALADAKHRHECRTGPYGPGKLHRGTPLPPVHLTRQHSPHGAPETEPQHHQPAKGLDHEPARGRSQDTGRGRKTPRPHSRPKKADRLRRHLT